MYLVILIILIIIFIFYTFSNKESFRSDKDILLGAKIEHLELAYKLCGNDNSKECRKFINYYENLRKSYHNLKKKYCKSNSKYCKDLGI